MTTSGAPAIDELLAELHRSYPDARYELTWTTPVQLLVATILAAQCTDERVNRVTATLFTTYPDAAAFAAAERGELEEALRPTGFFRDKARKVQEICQALVDAHGGEVPRSMAALIALPGLGRKSANVILGEAFGIAEGIIVDTHVARVAPRLGLSAAKQPERIERDLMAQLPEETWTFVGPALVLHGRYVCTARAPACATCRLAVQCPKIGL